jgi:hypothetical protein
MLQEFLFLSRHRILAQSHGQLAVASIYY